MISNVLRNASNSDMVN